MTREEYKRGIVSWTPGAPLMVRTRSGVDSSNLGEWSAPITDPRGSLVESSASPWREIEVRADSHAGFPDGFQLRWEFLSNAGRLTAVWDGLSMPEPSFVWAVPSYGAFERLLIHAGLLHCPDYVAVRVGDAVIEFSHWEDEWDDETEDGVIVPRSVVENRIEIVAPTSSDSEVSGLEEAYAVLGLVVLLLGENARGSALISEHVLASSAEQRAEEVRPDPWTTFDHQWEPEPSDLTERDLRRLDGALALLFSDEDGGAVGTGRRRAFRAFEQGGRALASWDRLLYYFTGIETLVRASGKNRVEASLAEILDDPRFFRLLQTMKREKKHLASKLGNLRSRVSEPAIAEYFAAYVERHALSDDVVAEFHRLKNLRNAVHGGTVRVSIEDAQAAKQLLLVLLKKELGLTYRLPSEAEALVQFMELKRTIDEGRPTMGGIPATFLLHAVS